jgi:erythromycin esterase-like protein
MFKKIFGNGLRIARAARLGTQEFAVDVTPSRRFGTFTKEATMYKAAIDNYIEEHDPNDKELLLFLLAPALEHIASYPERRALVKQTVERWVEVGEVRSELAMHALRKVS